MTDQPKVNPILELRGVSKTYGPVRALKSVSFKLYPGEVIALVGDNGAGKSTVSKVLSGLIRPDAGELLFAGKPRHFSHANEAREAGIETVFQTLAVVPNLDIVANMYLGRELYKGGPFGRMLRVMDNSRMQAEAGKGFRSLGLTLPDLRTKLGGLSGGQRQAVAIARAVLWGSKVVVLDEPTAALGVHQTEMVLTFIERLREHGVTVVLISHNMKDVMRVADRVIVLRLGEKTFDGDMSTLDATRLVGLITGAAEATAAVK